VLEPRATGDDWSWSWRSEEGGSSSHLEFQTAKRQISKTQNPRPCVHPKPLSVGDDSRFFALLGSAPQELNTVRPEAKLACYKLHARNPNSQQIFYCALAVETLYPRVTTVPTIRTFFSLKRLVVADT
jgi:hypothetical protein